MIQDDRLPLKEQYLDYYGKIPVKKYACYSIGIDEDTGLRWEKDDADFADRIRKSKSLYLLAKSKYLPPTFLIPLLFRELTPRTEITGKDGEKLFKVVRGEDSEEKQIEK